VRDAMSLPPSMGLIAPGSIDAHLDAAALEATRTAMRGAGWADETLVAIVEAIEAIDPGGAFVVTRRFTCGGTAVADLKVTVQGDTGGTADGTIIATGTTSSSGYVTFNLDAGSYHFLSPSNALYEASDTPVTVAANSSATITLTGQALPAAPSASTYCIIVDAGDENAQLVGAAAWTLQVTNVEPAGLATANIVQLTEANPLTTDANGRLTFEISRETTTFELLITVTQADGLTDTHRLIVDVDATKADAEGYIRLADLL